MAGGKAAGLVAARLKLKRACVVCRKTGEGELMTITPVMWLKPALKTGPGVVVCPDCFGAAIWQKSRPQLWDAIRESLLATFKKHKNNSKEAA